MRILHTESVIWKASVLICERSASFSSVFFVLSRIDYNHVENGQVDWRPIFIWLEISRTPTIIYKSTIDCLVLHDFNIANKSIYGHFQIPKASEDRCLAWRLYMSVAALGLRFEPSRTRFCSDFIHTKFMLSFRTWQRLNLKTNLA